MSGIIFPSDQDQAVDWTTFVSPNPLFNSTARAAMAFNAGIEALGFPNFDDFYIQGQYGFGAAAVSGAPTMELSRAIGAGLDQGMAVNIMGKRGEQTGISLGLTIRPFRSSFAYGLQSYVRELLNERGSDLTPDQFVFQSVSKEMYSSLAAKFAAGMRGV